MEHLWPEQEPELAANNLNKIIHAGRRALEPELKAGAASRFLFTHDQHVVLSAPGGLWIDIEEFEQRASAALKSKTIYDYEAALELYAGELLAEDRYEDWAAARHERLSRLAERLLAESAQFYEPAGQLSQSIKQMQQLIAFNDSNESAHRQLMRLPALNGSRHEALAQFQHCQAVLRKELDAEPEPKTLTCWRFELKSRAKSRTSCSCDSCYKQVAPTELRRSPTFQIASQFFSAFLGCFVIFVCFVSSKIRYRLARTAPLLSPNGTPRS